MNLRRMWLALLLASYSSLPSTLIAQSRGLKKVQVGVPAISMGNIVIYFTKEAKIFEKYGLDVEPVAVNGSGIASKALISGSVQISPIATPTVMSSVLAGSDMVILAHTMPGVIQYLMARPDIKRTEDIKGKTIGVTTFGSLTDFLVKYLARQKGLNPDKDFAMLQIGTRQRSVSSPCSRGGFRWRPCPIRIISMRNGPAFMCCGIFSRRLIIPGVRSPPRARRSSRTATWSCATCAPISKASPASSRSRSWARRVIKKMLRLNDDAMAQESWELFAKHRIAAPYPNIKGMKTSYEYVAATRPDVYKHKPEEFIDASFVEELDKSGFIKKLYEK